MRWLKRRRPIDPGAEYIAQLNAEAAERAANPPPIPYRGSVFPRFSSISNPTVSYSNTAPPASREGDIWFDGDSNTTRRWNGSEWQLIQIDVGSISANKITAGTINANHLKGTY